MSIGRREERQLRAAGMVKLPLGLGWVDPPHVIDALLDALEAAAMEYRRHRSPRGMALRRELKRLLTGAPTTGGGR